MGGCNVLNSPRPPVPSSFLNPGTSRDDGSTLQITSMERRGLYLIETGFYGRDSALRRGPDEVWNSTGRVVGRVGAKQSGTGDMQ